MHGAGTSPAGSWHGVALMMEQNLVLLSLQEGHKAQEAAPWHCQELRLGLGTSHTTLLQIWELTLPSLFFCFKGIEDFLEKQGQGSLGEVEQTPGFFPFLRKDQEGKWFPLPVLGYHTLAVQGLVDIPCWQVLGMVHPGEGTEYKNISH